MNSNLTQNSITYSSKTTPFDSQSIIDNGIIIKFNNKEEKKLFFYTIEKSFIKKHKISAKYKLGLVTIQILVLQLIFIYSTLEILFFMVLFVCIPVVLSIQNFSWYLFNVQLIDGTLYQKSFSKNAKQDHIDMVKLVRKGVCDYNLSIDFENSNMFNYEVHDVIHVQPKMNVA